VFTVPHELNPLALANPALFYDLLFSATAQTLLEVAANPEHLGAEIGFLSILHTWGQNLLLHPHIHCVIPAGGLAPDHTRWIGTQHRFLLPIPVLRKVFRGKFTAGLKRLHRKGLLDCSGPAAGFQHPKQFAQLMRTVHRQHWVVYAKQAMGGPAQVLRYLGRYTHRIAISNHRLLGFDGQRVTFRWKDYAHGSKLRIMTLDAAEFLRRFFLHVLPKGFVRIRHFGLLSNRFRTQRLPLARTLLAMQQGEPVGQSVEKTTSSNPTLWHCPKCGGPMCVLRRLDPMEINSS
jgi:hypothetical protein